MLVWDSELILYLRSTLLSTPRVCTGSTLWADLSRALASGVKSGICFHLGRPSRSRHRAWLVIVFLQSLSVPQSSQPHASPAYQAGRQLVRQAQMLINENNKSRRGEHLYGQELDSPKKSLFSHQAPAIGLPLRIIIWRTRLTVELELELEQELGPLPAPLLAERGPPGKGRRLALPTSAHSSLTNSPLSRS